MQVDLEKEQASALAAHLEVATRTYAAHLAQAQEPVDAIPEIVRQLQSVHKIATVVVEAAQESGREETDHHVAAVLDEQQGAVPHRHPGVAAYEVPYEPTTPRQEK